MQCSNSWLLYKLDLAKYFANYSAASMICWAPSHVSCQWPQVTVHPDPRHGERIIPVWHARRGAIDVTGAEGYKKTISLFSSILASFNWLICTHWFDLFCWCSISEYRILEWGDQYDNETSSLLTITSIKINTQIIKRQHPHFEYLNTYSDGEKNPLLCACNYFLVLFGIMIAGHFIFISRSKK